MRIAPFCLLCVVAGHGLVRASGSAVQQSGSSNNGAAALVDRFLFSTGTPIVSYRAFRRLEAETRGGRMRARLTAWTSLDPSHGFQYSIVEEDGSGTIRQKVLHAALEAERSISATGELGRGALTTSNYEFTAARGPEEGLVQIGIHPLRRDTMLVEGSILLTESDGDLVRVEGFLIRRPSIWTRRVEVVRRYARIGGFHVPVAMQSTAQVLLVGRSTFSMTYEYESINGEPVAKTGVWRGAETPEIWTPP